MIVLLCLIGDWLELENLYDIVKRKMRDTRPNNTDELKTAIKAVQHFFNSRMKT